MRKHIQAFLLLIMTAFLSACTTYRSLDGYRDWPDIIGYQIELYGEPDYIHDSAGSAGRVRRWGEKPASRWAVSTVKLFYVEERKKIEIAFDASAEEMVPMTQDEIDLLEFSYGSNWDQ